jgi:hypothetical protein
MANYRGHIAGGLVAGAACALVLAKLPVGRYAEAAHLLNSWQALAAFFVLSVLFALFPDVDTNSKGQDIFIGLAFTVDILLILGGNFHAAAYLGLVAMLPIVGHHRGWTHAKWAMIIVPLPLLILPTLYDEKLLPVAASYYLAAEAGYFSHLLLDGLIWRRVRVRG